MPAASAVCCRSADHPLPVRSPRFPAVERDLAVLCGAALPVAEIEKPSRLCRPRHLESVKPVTTIYRSSQIADSQKSPLHTALLLDCGKAPSPTTKSTPHSTEFKNLEEKGWYLRFTLCLAFRARMPYNTGIVQMNRISRSYAKGRITMLDKTMTFSIGDDKGSRK